MKIWTNGCFDILHRGHMEMLAYAKSLGTHLVVGIDSDERVKKLKGPSRPINNQEDRKKMLEAIQYVDRVVIFNDDVHLENSIKNNKIHTMVVGSDWEGKKIIGSSEATRVVYFDRLQDYSTTSIIKERRHDMCDSPIKFVPKGWGFEKWIVNCEEYCGKLLYFVKDKRCSWHYHKLKDEVFYVHSGKLLVKYSEGDDINGAYQKILTQGNNFHVYRGLRHQMIALEDTEMFEFSTQHSDDDSYRIIKGD